MSYAKYLKYKTKYLNLVNIAVGGGRQTALDYFKANFSGKIILADKFLMQKIPQELAKKIQEFDKIVNEYKTLLDQFSTISEQEKPAYKQASEEKKTELKEAKTRLATEIEKIFECIYDLVDKNNDTIDWIIYRYLNDDKFGEPSSLENYGRFNTAIVEYNKLPTIFSDGVTKKTLIHNIASLQDLESYVTIYQGEIDIVDKKKGEKDKKEQYQRELKEKGEKDVIVELETEQVIIYNPTTVNGSKYYGRNTKWCTASQDDNMFDYYTNQGKLYIIEPKMPDPIDEKYQLHVPTSSLMDSTDKPIKFEDLHERFRDKVLHDWIATTWIMEMGDTLFNDDGTEFVYRLGMFKHELTQYHIINIFCQTKESTDFTKKLENALKEIKALIDDSLKYPLGDSLAGLTGLQTLDLRDFNYPLGESLVGLTSLQTLDLHDFNYPLGESLVGLTSLQELYLFSFDQPLGESLAKLTSLQTLDLHDFNNPFDESLAKLTSLKTLKLYSFNQPLGESLVGLTSLQTLHFIDFNNPFDESLAKLTSLKTLRLYKFNQPLGESLVGLTSLQTLDFFDFNHPLGESLAGLTGLQTLYLYRFNRPLGESLVGLINLKSLVLESFDHPLDNSLTGLTNLKTLFLQSFDHPLGNSLAGLTNLKTLFLPSFDQPLSNSFAGLTNLETLILPSFKTLSTLSEQLKYLKFLEKIKIHDSLFNAIKNNQDLLNEIVNACTLDVTILSNRNSFQTSSFKKQLP